jgi:hypothetical protein
MAKTLIASKSWLRRLAKPFCPIRKIKNQTKCKKRF